MDESRITARNALHARSAGIGLVLTALVAAATGGVTGVLAREETAPAPVAAEPKVAPPSPRLVPRPRRTVYVQVPGVPAPQPASRPARRSAPRTPVAPPRRTQQAPVTRSDGS